MLRTNHPLAFGSSPCSVFSGFDSGFKNAESSSRPRELGGRETGLALVLDPERVDLRAGRLSDRQVRRHRVEHALEPNRLTVLHTEGHDVLDLEIDRVANANAVANAVVLDIDCGSLATAHLSNQRRQRCHRAAELA